MEKLHELEKEKKPTDADAAFREHIMKKWKKLNAVQTHNAKEYNEEIIKKKQLDLAVLAGEVLKLDKQNKEDNEDEEEDNGPKLTEFPIMQPTQQDNEDDDEEGEEDENSGLENVRVSNKAYAQTKVNDFICSLLAAISTGCCIVSEELNYYNKEEAGDESDMLLYFSLGITGFLIIFIIIDYALLIRWMQTKLLLTEIDNICTTGLWKTMVFECVLVLIQPLPWLKSYNYEEEFNSTTIGIEFPVNDVLIFFMVMIRLYMPIRTILSQSFYTDPRAQRVCSIYGCYADYQFALKSIMIENSWMLLIMALIISLTAISYSVRLFERHVDPDLEFMSTAMWYTLITMTTVGYGDYFAQSHMGRFVGIITAFWGVFVVSLFVVSIQNILNYDSPEQKSYNLLKRLETKELMRLHAANMLRAKYKIKMKRNQQGGSTLSDEAFWDRKYREHRTYFKQVSKAYRNIGDVDSELENVKNSVEMLMKEI